MKLQHSLKDPKHALLFGLLRKPVRAMASGYSCCYYDDVGSDSTCNRTNSSIQTTTTTTSTTTTTTDNDNNNNSNDNNNNKKKKKNEN